MKKICGVISKEELKELLKKKIRYTGRCSDCPFSKLDARFELTCSEMSMKLFDICPNSCEEINNLLCNFLNKFRNNQNKI